VSGAVAQQQISPEEEKKCQQNCHRKPANLCRLNKLEECFYNKMIFNIHRFIAGVSVLVAYPILFLSRLRRKGMQYVKVAFFPFPVGFIRLSIVLLVMIRLIACMWHLYRLHASDA